MPTAITPRVGSARPMFGDADRDEGVAVQVTEPDPDRQRDEQPDAERRRGELELLDRLVPQEARVLLDEPEGVAEDGEIRDHEPALIRVHGVRARCASDEQPVGDERERDGEDRRR